MVRPTTARLTAARDRIAALEAGAFESFDGELDSLYDSLESLEDAEADDALFGDPVDMDWTAEEEAGWAFDDRLEMYRNEY